MDRSQLLRHGTDDGVMWRLDHLDGLEVLDASFATHEFPKHMHPTYVIEVVDAGANEFTCGDQTHRAEVDDVVLINPFEVHAGRPVGPVPPAVGARLHDRRKLVSGRFFGSSVPDPLFPPHDRHHPRTVKEP